MTCEWREDADSNWETSCGESCIIPEGTPTENGMLFCWHCGKPLREVRFVDPLERQIEEGSVE